MFLGLRRSTGRGGVSLRSSAGTPRCAESTLGNSGCPGTRRKESIGLTSGSC